MEQITIEKNMREAVNKIEEIGGLYAEAKGLSYQFQKMREVILSREMSSLEGSMASREMYAKSTLVYAKHLEATAKCIENETKLRAYYEKWKAQFEACRSLLSLEKSKSKIV